MRQTDKLLKNPPFIIGQILKRDVKCERSKTRESENEKKNDEWGNCLQKFLNENEKIFYEILLEQVQNRNLYPI